MSDDAGHSIPFRPSVGLTDLEWRALEELHRGGTPEDVAARLALPEARFRLVVRNAAEKLRVYASI